MIINSANIQALFIGFKTEFQKSFDNTPTFWEKVASKTTSMTSEELYAWLGQFPMMREWIGERVLKDMSTQDYTIRNKDFESTVAIKRSSLEDDNYGIYASMMAEMGRMAKAHPDKLIAQAILEGKQNRCYDGQNFFDKEHPVFTDVAGNDSATPASNLTEGTKPAWLLLDVSRGLKPFIYQERKAPVFTGMLNPEDEKVFMSGEYRYGVDSRGNVGYGFWQMAHRAEIDLTSDSYGEVRAQMGELKADGGLPLGIVPNLLVVPPRLEGAARKLLTKDAYQSNEWAGSAELVVAPWLA